ncbi:CAF1-domain-containing protein [Gigaspora margarita]|uniref:CAF1-domain-containing protein n=1 Tax=Gigaspora margarita TaxID=4874 RepID=A0A8H3WV65_GIGMA|nr:CAF1-domain-containing protein [Gigaspora margarita]
MEVLKSNFHELLPTITDAIQGADFIALDTELTGLSEHIERIKSFDDPHSRYLKVRAAATKFLIIQFGLCTFTYNKDEDTFVACPFNFYIFPANTDKRDNNDICFMCSGSSLHFLMKCGFDFNKLISQGMPYMNHTDEAKLLQRRADVAQRQTDSPPDDETKVFVDKAIASIEAWLDSHEKQLKISTPHISQKRLIFQEIRARFSGLLSAESKPKCIMLEKLSDEQKEKKSRDEAAEALAASINFRVIIELLVQSKKPLVGHNCLLDICQIVHQFWQDLPEKLKDWKKLVHGLFDVVIDTKHLAATHRKLQSLLPRNSVQDILEIVQEEQFEKLAPKVVLDPKFTRYTFNDINKNHEAGYDAYITGYNFIRMAVFILHEKEEKVDVYANVWGDIPTNGLSNEDMEIVPEQDNDDDDNEMNLFQYMMSTEKLSRFYNKLHLLRSDFKYINLDGDDGYPPTKTNGFLISNIPASCSKATMNVLFEDYGNIFFQWIDDTHCWLTVKEDKKVNKVPHGILGQSKMFSEFLEGGKKYDLAQEKGITKEMGEIYIQSWGNWIQAILEAEEDENVIESQSTDITPFDGIKDETYDDRVEEIEFEYQEPFPIPRDELSTWGCLNDWKEDGNAEDTSSEWGQPPSYFSDTINTGIKRTLSAHITDDDNRNENDINDAFKKTKIGFID